MLPLLLLLTVLSLSGCATLVNGDMVAVPVTTDPPGAQVRANGQTYTTPATVMLPRGQGQQILVFIEDGRDREPVALQEVTSGWAMGNAVFGFLGILFAAIDAGNPHGYTLEPIPAHYQFATGTLGPLAAEPTPAGAWDGP